MAFLIDAGWMEVLVGAIALFLSIFIYLNRKKKSLSYEIISMYKLVSIDERIRGQLKVTLNGKPVKDLRLLLVKFTNNGNIPIAADDYERPLTLNFKSSTNIISADYLMSHPENLVTSLMVSQNKLSIAPMLMNEGDYFHIKVLLEKDEGSNKDGDDDKDDDDDIFKDEDIFDVDCRIIGVKNVVDLDPEEIRLTPRRAIIGATKLLLTTLFIFGICAALRWGLPYLIDPPKIININTSAPEIEGGSQFLIWANVENSKDGTDYEWKATSGDIKTEGPVKALAMYTAPETPESD